MNRSSSSSHVDHLSLHVHDCPRGVGKFRQALAVHPVIHECSASLCQNETAVAKNLQMMGYRGLLNRKMLYDLANANRVVIVGEQVENANTHRVGKGFEATGVLLRARSSDLRRPYLGATIGSRTFYGRWHGGVETRVPDSSKNVNESSHRCESASAGVKRDKLRARQTTRDTPLRTK